MELCLGTVQLGMQYGIQNNKRPSVIESMDILTEALTRGIRWFDTASAYGEAERILGQFAECAPSEAKSMRIVSKLAPDVFQGIPRQRWQDAALKCAKGSLQRLKKEKLDVFLFHNATHIFDPMAVEALTYVYEMGLTQSIGVSVYTPEEAMQALKYPQISSIQIPYNVFDQRLDRCGFFAEAKEKNVHVYARSSLLQGLAVMHPENLPSHMRFAVPYLEKFHLICQELSIDPLQAAISYVTGNPNIDQIVFGVDSKAQLAEYVAMQHNPLPIKSRSVLFDAFANVEEKLVNPSLWKR